MFTQQDLDLLKSKGITAEQAEKQIKSFELGFPFLDIKAAASIGNGLISLNDEEKADYLTAWEAYQKENHRIVKFVPASGAASRMFKNLFAFLAADYDVPTTDFEKQFFNQINSFAFFDALNDACEVYAGEGVEDLVNDGNYKLVVKCLLSENGLNYGALPKGLLQFHQYVDTVRTPVEEHLVEGALYAADGEGKVCLHFTVSAEHRALFEELIADKKSEYEKLFNVKYEIDFSVQKSNTDTIAVDMKNHPFRNDDNSLLFRPGGHGALIQNLNEIKADVVFVKNIDNVVPDSLKKETVTYKKLIGGVLVKLQRRVFDYLRKLVADDCSTEELDEILLFVENELCCKRGASDENLKSYLLRKLNRPMRVCGMVKNVGEPGGGPFLAVNPDGSVSCQILESSQIDTSDAKKKAMFEQGTHFNPVDLVCAIKDYKGEPFDLPHFVDPATGFISYKSKSGRDLKALELPGLWNGAMSDWNTLFVEVPLDTFNPVKTVNDLLRREHQ